MRQRVGIAQALLNDPELLVVDEPTTGLDPEERVRFRNLLSDLAGERIVILSTHIVPDVESGATDLVIIDHGRLVAHEAPERLLAGVEGRVWQWTIASAEFAGRSHNTPFDGRRVKGRAVMTVVGGEVRMDRLGRQV